MCINEHCRETFQDDELVFDGNEAWHKLDTCYWSSPYPIAGYVDLQSTYPKHENFFTKRLGVKRVSLPMLIREVEKMAGQKYPKIADIQLRLVEVGRILAKNDFDQDTLEALESLRKVSFLPKRLTEGKRALVGIEDDFAIIDNPRYGKALADHGILLDFDIHETQMMHVMFQHYGLTSRYLSVAVNEQSTISGDSLENFSMSRLLQVKAYALYW